MAVHIRLSRHGCKKAAFYRVVVADQRKPRDGRFIEALGTFDPKFASGGLNVNVERLDYWRKQGAKPSHTLERLLKTRVPAADGAS